MLKIYLARHGQNFDNVNGVLNGHRDEPLTPLGEEQAHATAKYIKEAKLNFAAIYSSPLKRAFRTAEIIASDLNLSQPTVEEDLIERNFGIMSGYPVSKIEEMCSPDIIKTDTITYFLSPEGAETFPQLIERGKKVIDRVQAKHPEGAVLLVTHGDIGKMVYAAYYKLDWENVLTSFHFGNCEVLLLSEDSPASEAHYLKQFQHNH